MKKILTLLLFVQAWIVGHNSFSQQIYNEKNVDRNIPTEFYPNPQKVRLMEYTTDQQGNNPERRLETLPENGLPHIKIRVLNNNFEEFFMIDQPPFDDNFDNGVYEKTYAQESQTILFSTQAFLSVIKDKFGWSGLDNQSANSKPIIWNIISHFPSLYANALYNLVSKEFYFLCNGNELDRPINIDGVGHEIMHGIYDARVPGGADQEISPCSESRVVKEAISDIIGLYAQNEHDQNSPAFYNWNTSKGIISPGRDFEDPNFWNHPDTYFGHFYENACPIDLYDYDVHQNVTVITHWFYLLSTGTLGTQTNDLGLSYKLNGIGVHKSAQIVWKCIDFMTTMSGFADMKTATRLAAEQLYGANSSEYFAVENAWCAVGVCDDNQKGFTMSPANGTFDVEPWPTTQVSLTWEDQPVLEWEVQMSTKYDFSESLQTYKVSNFTTLVNPKGGITYTATVNGYYHPGERVYARARITQADPNFCRTATNPLCALYQVFSPAHAFTLSKKKASFFSWIQGNNKVNPWKDPTLTWKSVNGAQKYTFQVFTDKALTTLVSFGTVNHSSNFQESGVISTPLENGKKYYTRVRALRTNIPQIVDNNGAWSEVDSIYTVAPPTEVFQAKSQKANDPAKEVSSMGFWVGWDPAPGADAFVIQIATDAAFTNMIRTHNAAGNLTTDLVSLPLLPNLTNLFVRVLPKKGPVYSTCLNTWRVITNENLGVPAMNTPADGSPIEYKDYWGEGFGWKANTLNMALVDHFELHLTKKSSGLTTMYTTDKFDIYIQDQLLFDSKQGIKAKVRAVGPSDAKSAFSAEFSYPICPDQPLPKFPGDFDKIDPSKAVTFSWHPSQWVKPGDNYLLTIMDNGIPIFGFNNAPTTSTSMNVPANTLQPNKTYSFNVQNQGSCPGLKIWTVVFSTLAGGSNNPPATPVKNFAIELRAFRNDPDANFIPPAFGTSDYFMGFELFDPNGVKIPVFDGNGQPISQLLVDSENAIVGIAVNQMPIGKYTLRLKMLNIVTPVLYFPFDQPRFSVFLDGNVVVSNHVITIDLVNPASPFNEWQIGFQFADILIDVK